MNNLLQIFVYGLEHRVQPINVLMLNLFSFSADTFTFLAYTWIAGLLLWLSIGLEGSLRKFSLMFSSFIFLCGLTHIMRAIIIFYPLFEVKVIIQTLCSVISVVTAIMLSYKIKILSITLQAALGRKLNLVENAIIVAKDIQEVKTSIASNKA